MSLPTEIIHLIIDILVLTSPLTPTRQDLRSCLRVDRNFYTRSRYHLFSTTTLKVIDEENGVTGRAKADKLHAVLLGHYGPEEGGIAPLITCVRRLDIEYVLTPSSTVGSWGKAFRRFNALFNSPSILGVLRTLLNSECQFGALSIIMDPQRMNCYDVKIGWDEMGCEFTGVVRRLCEEKLVELTLVHVTMFPMQMLQRTGLKRLTLKKASILPPTTEVQQDLELPPLRLQYLCIGDVLMLGNANSFSSALFAPGPEPALPEGHFPLPALREMKELCLTQKALERTLVIMQDILSKSPMVERIRLEGLDLPIRSGLPPAGWSEVYVPPSLKQFKLSGVITDPAAYRSTMRLYELEDLLSRLPLELEELHLQLSVKPITPATTSYLEREFGVLQPRAQSVWQPVVTILKERYAGTRLTVAVTIWGGSGAVGSEAGESATEFVREVFRPLESAHGADTLSVQFISYSLPPLSYP